jgi:hypothetical protein
MQIKWKLRFHQTRCPSANEWIKKLWYVDTKKNEIISFAGKWVKLEIIMLTK